MHFIAKKNLGKKQTVYFFCILQNRTNQKRFLKTHSLLEIAYEISRLDVIVHIKYNMAC